MKRITILALILALLLSMILVACGDKPEEEGEGTPAPEQTEAPEFPEEPSEGLNYYINDDGDCVINGIGTCTDTMIRIPQSISGHKVVTVYTGDGWRKREGDAIKGVLIPEGVKKLAAGESFYGFSYNLKHLVLPEGPMMIDSQAISSVDYMNDPNYWVDGAMYIGNHLITVDSSVNDTFTVREGTTDIASSAFYESEVTHVVIPDSVEIINDGAFKHCASLVRLTLGKGIKYIGYEALYNCEELSRIAYAGSESDWKSIEKSNFCGGTTSRSYKVIYDWSDTEIGGSTIVPGTTDLKYFTFELNSDEQSYKVGINVDYIGDITEYHIPAEYEGLPVTAIRSFGGIECIEVITMPDTITSIDRMALGWNPNLTTLKLSASLTELPEDMCAACDKLNNVVIPASVKKIGDYAFGECMELRDLRFEGTVAQWEAVEKAEWWYYGYGTTVKCSDGSADIGIEVN